jgi:hypothetical protein
MKITIKECNYKLNEWKMFKIIVELVLSISVLMRALSFLDFTSVNRPK